VRSLESVIEEIKEKKKNLAVVLGASYGGLSIVRSLGKEGIPVIVIGTTNFIGCSRYCVYYVNAKDNSKVVRNLVAIAEKYDRKIALMTDSDNYIKLIYQNWDILKERYGSHICKDLETFELLTDKSKLYLVSNQLGIDSPKTYFSYELDRISRFPVIVKPIDKSKLPSIKGEKVAVCKNKEQLVQIVDYVKLNGTDCVIQEIIEGDIRNLFSVTLFRSSDGQVLQGYSGYKIRQFPVNFGTVSSFVVNQNRELLDMSIQILNKIGYIGVANFEYKYNPEENKYYIIEVNGRFPMSTGVTEILGNKFVYNVYRSCLSQDMHQSVNTHQSKVVWVHFLQDLRARMQLKRRSLSVLKLKANGYKIKWALWDRRDIKPALVYLKDSVYGRLIKRN